MWLLLRVVRSGPVCQSVPVPPSLNTPHASLPQQGNSTILACIMPQQQQAGPHCHMPSAQASHTIYRVSFAPSSHGLLCQHTPVDRVYMSCPCLCARPQAAQNARPSWFPGTPFPAHLDGSLPGDHGFDPCGLGTDPAKLKW